MSLLQLHVYCFQELVRDGLCVLGTTVLRVTGREIAPQQLPQLIPPDRAFRIAGRSAVQFPIIIFLVFIARAGDQLGGKVVEDRGHQAPGLYVEAHTGIVEGAVISAQNLGCIVDDVSES